MRIAVFGAGGIGGYFGGRLARAGNDVTFIARGAHLAALREGGLRIRSASGDFALPVRATDQPAEAPAPADLVLIAVKSYDTAAAVAGIAPLVGPETAILTLQNGVSNHAAFAEVYGAARVLAGTAQIEATIGAPGTIEQPSPFARIALGALVPEGRPRAEGAVAALVAAGLEARFAPDTLLALWQKFIFLSPLAGVTALTGLPVGEVRGRRDTRELLAAALDETVAAGRASGVALGPDAAAGVLTFVDGLPAAMKTSLQRDLERGGRLETEALQGEVVRLGRDLGVPTPVNLALYVYLATADARRRPPG